MKRTQSTWRQVAISDEDLSYLLNLLFSEPAEAQVAA